MKIGIAGVKDSNNDCWISIELTENGGIQIESKSKVEVMYGEANRNLISEVLKTLGIENAKVDFEDSGALPYVISARVEAAVKRIEKTDAEFLPKIKSYTTYSTAKDKFRRSRLYLPGNTPKYSLNAGIHNPDAVILDLEDSVSPTEKDAALIMVRNALRQVNFYGAEKMVRINQDSLGLEELESIVPSGVNVVLIPKCESAEQVKEVAIKINSLNPENPVWLMPIIESALGGIKAYEIATASEMICSVAIGLEDYTADIGTQRTTEEKESFWLKSQIVNAAKAAGVQPIDTVFSDVADEEGLRESVLSAKSLGFEGKGCIHPRQIRIIHEAMRPNEAEITKAQRIVEAFEQAEKEGLGVVSLGTKMIDPPVVKRALRTVKLAEV